ncbi:hypothetical protein O0L34_g14333 [Tuta absoluta]|nr:hypothetical protein O0L34_g14333 [Tuta absoluta]
MMHERDLPARLAAELVKPSKSTPALHHATQPPPSGPVSPSGSAASAAQVAWALKSRSSHNLAQPSQDAFYQNLQSVHSHATLQNRLSDVRSSGGSARPQSAHLGADATQEQAHQHANQNAMTVRAAKLAEMSEEVSRRQQQQQMQQQQMQQQQHMQQQQMMQQQMYQQKLPHQHGLGSPLLSQSQQTLNLNTTMSPPNHQPILSPHMHMHTGTALYQAASAQQSPYAPQAAGAQQSPYAPQAAGAQQSPYAPHQQHLPQSPHLPQHQQHLSQQQHMPQSPHLPHQQHPYGQSPQQRYDWHPPGPPSPQRTQPPVAPKPQGVRRSEPEPSEQPQPNSGAQVDDERYVASALEPPSVSVYPAGARTNPVQARAPPGPAHAHAHNPWQREQRERQQEARVQANRQRRDAAIAHLVSLGASRTPVQNQQLRALQLERDFERRATQHDQDDAVNTEFIDDDDINAVLQQETPPPAPAPAPSNPPQPPKSILKTNRTELTNGYSTNDTNQRSQPVSHKRTYPGASPRPPPPPSRGSSFAAMASHCRALSPPAPPAPLSPRSAHHEQQPPHSPPGGRDKRVSFHELAAVATPPAPPAPATSPPASPEPHPHQAHHTTREDPDRFITEAENMLAGASQSSPTTSPATSPAAQPTPGVIGAQEVYRDPRARRLAEKSQRLGAAAAREPVPETLSFHEKMKLFALEAGDPHTPKDKVKISRAQRDIDAVH